MTKATPPLITISGPPGSGTTTLAEAIVDEFDFEHVSGGDIFRRLAKERGISLATLTEKAEEDDSIDRELDERLRQLIEAHVKGDRETDGDGLVVESRLAGWHAKGDAELAICLDASVDVRIDRVSGREETTDEMRKREQSEAQRYREYYGIDITDYEVYDLVIDTGTLSEQGMNRLVADAVRDVSR